MKSLNKEAVEIFKRLIFEANKNEGHTKIENDKSFMSVHVERLNEVRFGNYKSLIYSIAHYGEQNGDLMSDPEMTFLYIEEIDKVYPLSFTNHYAGIYKESLFQEEGKWKINKKEQSDEAIFANQWMKNIRQQQNI